MILVDGHVHLYPCFDLPMFLDSALENFRRAARISSDQPKLDAVLLLTESSGHDAFAMFADKAAQGTSIGPWTIKQRLGADPSLTAQHRDGGRLIMVAGRQIVTAENLEVLALGTDRHFADGRPLAEVAGEVTEAGGLAAIPWGTGKWLGRRGKILTDLIIQPQPFRFFLGDNGGRPFFWPQVTHFELARAKGIPVLPGSDPLPFPGEEKRAGSYGFRLKDRLDRTAPAESLKKLLSVPDLAYQPYGRHEGFTGFFRNQIRMQIKNRTKRVSP